MKGKFKNLVEEPDTFNAIPDFVDRLVLRDEEEE
jgi:hypothetical protein